jgi:hypothetical protein
VHRVHAASFDYARRMPTSYTPFRLTESDAFRLADMAGVQMDLRTVAATCAQLGRKRDRDGLEDMLGLEAMQDRALVRYGRCFKGGVRTAFVVPQAWIEALAAELREAHAYFIDLRDKHIAHSVNDWEMNVPVAYVGIDHETGAIAPPSSISVQQHRMVMIGSESVDRLWHLAKALADRVEAEMEVEKAKLLEVARRIPAEEIKRRIHKDPAIIPGRGDVGSARGR